MKTKTLNRKSNEKGMALIIVLLVVLVFAILGSAFISRTVNEKNTAEREKLLNQAFYLAEAGGDSGLAKLDELINTYLLNTINATSPNVVSTKASTYASTNNSLGLLIEYVKLANVAQLTLNGSEAKYNGTNTSLGSGAYVYNISIRQKGNPVTISADMWDFPYYYQVTTTATVQNLNRKVALNGDFTVRVQRDNFAKFALFTDHHTMPDLTTVWFTNRTNFAGPLHTNERYSFAFNPSGVFDGVVTQQYATTRFYNNGFPLLADAASNGVVDVPTFNSTYTRNAPAVVLASNVVQADLANQASAGTAVGSTGIYVPVTGGNMKGGIYVKGNPTITMAVVGGNAQYTIAVSGVTTRTITVDRTLNRTGVKIGAAATTYYNGLPDGVDNLGTILYVEGTVNGLSGTVQRDTQMTISSTASINITNNIKYEDYTAAVGTPGVAGYVPPSAANKTNLLGLVSWSGDINITTAAPNNIEVHAIAMARNGILQVNNYGDTGVGSRGTATLLGGVITQYYGAFGLFDSATGNAISGYGRNFVYDSRTLLGTAPPYFPSMSTFIAFTNDLTDKVTYQEGGF
jgi:Tfp pilus assembly protein PilX